MKIIDRTHSEFSSGNKIDIVAAGERNTVCDIGI